MSTATYAERMTQQQRLIVLRLLASLPPSYAASSGNIREELARWHHRLSRDQMHTMLAWLAEQGLVVTETIGPVVNATLTARGLDVANGEAVVPGVERHTDIAR